MEDTKPLSQEEFKNMLVLLKRYSEVHMDQWECWKMDTNKGKLFIDMRLSTPNPEDAYDDLSDVAKP